MKKTVFLITMTAVLLMSVLSSCSNFRGDYQKENNNAAVQSKQADPDRSEAEITRGRGGGRGGVGIAPRRPANDPYRSGYRSPTTRPAPAPGIGRGLLGFGLGAGLGALFGSILNPFSGAYGFGFSLFGLLFWVIVLFFAYRFFRNFLSKTRV